MITDNSVITSLLQTCRLLSWRFIYISLTTLVVISFLGFNELYIAHSRFIKSRTIEIPSGFGSRMIGDKLKQEGFIRSKWMFVTYVSLRGEASLLKPGTYDFNHASIATIARELVKGALQEKIITLPEGGTLEDLVQLLQDQDIDSADDFREFAMRSSDTELEKKYPFLIGMTVISGLEGYLFPDTYHVFKNASSEDIAHIFLQNFDKKITPEMHDHIIRSGKTLREIIIIASMIEKEVIADEDRNIVSSILANRLRLGMPLQVDATITFIKKQQHRDTSTHGRISRADLSLKSAYNTYLHRGLPIGPIGNPGMSAIVAAIYPTSSPYLYYLSDPNGRTIFSRTLEEHNIAKAKYLK